MRAFSFSGPYFAAPSPSAAAILMAPLLLTTLLAAGEAQAVREDDDEAATIEPADDPGSAAEEARAPGEGQAELPPATAEPELKILRIAMQDLKVTGLDPRLASVVTDSLLVELRKMRGVSVIGMDEIRAMLDQEANKSVMGCDEETSCLADIAGALGAEELLSGSIAVIGDEYVFGLRRIHQAEAKVTASLNRRLKKGDGEELLAAVGPAIAELFPDLTLRKGKERGVADEVALKLNPPPLRPWVFWSAAGLTAVLASGAVTLWVSNLVAVAYYRLLVLPSLSKPGASLSEVEPVQVAVNVLFVLSLTATLSAAATVLATVVSFPFTDFAGYQDAVIVDEE